MAVFVLITFWRTRQREKKRRRKQILQSECSRREASSLSRNAATLLPLPPPTRPLTFLAALAAPPASPTAAALNSPEPRSRMGQYVLQKPIAVKKPPPRFRTVESASQIPCASSEAAAAFAARAFLASSSERSGAGKSTLPIPPPPELPGLPSSSAKSAATSEGTAAAADGAAEESMRKKSRPASGFSEALRIQDTTGPIAWGLKAPPRKTGATGGVPQAWNRAAKCETEAERANLRKAAAEAEEARLRRGE